MLNVECFIFKTLFTSHHSILCISIWHRVGHWNTQLILYANCTCIRRIRKAYVMSIVAFPNIHFTSFNILCLFSRIGVPNIFFRQFTHLNAEYRKWWMMNDEAMNEALLCFYRYYLSVYYIQSLSQASQLKWYSVWWACNMRTEFY